MYTCKKCKKETKAWTGKCPACGAYQSLQAGSAGRRAMLDSGVPKTMKEVVNEDVHRIFTGTREFDRVLGNGMVQGSVILIGGNPGQGKMQPLTSKVLTPGGWSTMGQMVVGAQVIGADGKPTRVVAVHPNGVRDVYKVRLSDGGETLCGSEHLWQTRTRNQRVNRSAGSVKTTKQLIETLKLEGGRLNHSIPYAEPARFSAKAPLPLQPYVMGMYLADGSKCGANVIFSKPEKDVIDKVERNLPTSDRLAPTSLKNPSDDWRVQQKERVRPKTQTATALEFLGLSGKDAFGKFIPEIYKLASVPDRIELLRGLLDGDGHIAVTASRTTIEYSSSSTKLASDVSELVWGLGGRATTTKRTTKFTNTKGKKVCGAPSYRVLISFPESGGIIPVSSAKHTERYSGITRIKERYIESIEPAGQMECQCITVDNPDGLYVTDDFIVTHNSTLCLQVGCELADALEDPCKVLYVSGEETPSQVRQRGSRIAPEMSSLILCNETEVKKIQKHVMDLDPDILIIDSIQTMRAPGMEEARAGTVSQVQESTAYLTGLCKARGITAILVGHVNKDGDIAGPKTLEHLVDVVLNFGAERSSDIRVLSALKNRFGATSEVGVFRMTKDGLASVDDPTEHILRGKKAGAGSVLSAVMMTAGAGAGSRAMIVEIQCLITPTKSSSPKRVIEGYDRTRLEMVLAIMGKYTEFKDIGQNDIYINLGGGFENVEQHALDLPVVLAMISDHIQKPLVVGCIAWGELGLSGEVRPEERTDKRISMCDAMKIKKERRIYSDTTKSISLRDALVLAGLVLPAIGEGQEAGISTNVKAATLLGEDIASALATQNSHGPRAERGAAIENGDAAPNVGEQVDAPAGT